MKNILIGSRAIYYYDQSIPIKNTTDFDILSDKEYDFAENHKFDHLNNYDIEKYTNENDFIYHNKVKLYIPSMKCLAMIKRSHLWRNLSFAKHITMYHKHMQDKNFVNDMKFLNERTEMTHKEYDDYISPRLNVSIDEFFNDSVDKKYDHDYLHELFAYNGQPMYTRLQNGNDSVWCHIEYWNTFTFLEKCQCVSEETMVIAAERMLIPSNWKYSSKLAYIRSLEKVCTTLTSGWFRDFAIDNYPTIMSLYDESRFNKVKHTLENPYGQHRYFNRRPKGTKRN